MGGTYENIHNERDISSIAIRENYDKQLNEHIKYMREATIAEQKYVQDNIDKISVPTGLKFWD